MTPRIVRNFWLKVRCDGRLHDVATAPTGANGGMEIEIGRRNEGEIDTEQLWVRCFVASTNCDWFHKGDLVTIVETHNKATKETMVVYKAACRR